MAATKREEREEVLRALIEELAKCPYAQARRALLRMLVWDRIGREPIWGGFEMYVPFDEDERQSGYADEMLSAVEDLLTELGYADEVTLVAAPARP